MRSRILVLGFFLLILTNSLVFAVKEDISLEKIIIVPKPSEFKVDLWFDKKEGATYKPGEDFTVFVKPSHSSYIYVFDITPDGEVRLLFPNKYESNNFVSANTIKRIPDPQSQYSLKVSGKPGKEIVQVIAVKSKLRLVPIPLIEEIPILSREPLKFFTDVIKKQLLEDWTSATSYFYVGIVPTQGTVVLESEPRGAYVYVDGRYRGTTPLRITLDSGDHFAVFYLEGYEPIVRDFEVKSNRVTTVEAIFEKPKRTGRITIRSEPLGAQVYVNGVYRGTTPLEITLEEGEYELRVVHPDYVEEYKLNFGISQGSNVVYTFPFYQKKQKLGTLEIYSNPLGAKVFLNGKYYGDTPLTVQINEGEYELVLIKEGYRAYVTQIEVDANIRQVVSVNLTRIE
ncbi:MAG TPA: hypothetical protein DHV12_07705 [Thermotogae bacterium]|nr:hypothetical protein [Thermotogota bacterium]HCZ06996.1 hypothetical protein [Thermotogota bacterium]